MRHLLGRFKRSIPSTGALFSWVLFGVLTTLVGYLALPSAGRLYDFRAFYAAGALVRHNAANLFDLHVQEQWQNAVVCPMWRGVPFYHPAYEALLYAPLSTLTYQHAYLAYIACNLLLLLGCYCLAPVPADVLVRRVPRPLLFFTAFPVFMAILAGQDSILFLFMLCLIWRALDSAEYTWAGVLLGLALFKLQLVLVLALFLGVRLGRRFVVGFTLSAVAVAAVSLSITGVQGSLRWFHLMAQASVASHYDHHTQAVIAVYPLAMPSLNGLLFACGGRLLSASASLMLDGVLSCAVFALVFYLAIRLRSINAVFCAGLCCAVLITPHLFLYDYAALLFLVLLLGGRLQPLLVAMYYVLPWVLFKLKGLDLFAVMALLPIVALVQIILEFNSARSLQTYQHPHPAQGEVQV